MQKHIQHNKDERRHSSLEKYTSHFIWNGCVWEGVGDWTELQHIDLHSYGHNSVSSSFSWAALGHGPHSSIFSPTATAQSGAWGPPLLGAGSLSRILSPTDSNFLSPGLYDNLTPTLFPASVTISHSIQPLDSQGYILIFLDRMQLLFTQVHFLFWLLGRVGGQYTTLCITQTMV